MVFHHFVMAFDLALYTGKAENSRGPWDLWLASYPFEIAPPGNLSVCLFFALSGYVLAGSFNRTSLGVTALVVRRYVRLGLPIFVVVMISWALHATGAIQNAAVAPLTRSNWLNPFMTGDLTFWRALLEGGYGSLIGGTALFDPSLWTMSIEFVGSLVLIVIFVVTRMCGGPRTLMPSRGVLLILFVIETYNSYLFLFGIGAAMALFDLRRHSQRWCEKPWFAVCLIGLGLSLGMMSGSEIRPHFVAWILIHIPIHHVRLPLLPNFGMQQGEPFWHAWGAVLLLIAIDGSPRLRHMFAGHYFQFLGRISFPLYLIHFPLLLSVGCGTYLLMIGNGIPVIAATAIAFVVYTSAAIAAGIALSPVETLAVRLSVGCGYATQSMVVRVRRMLTGSPKQKQTGGAGLNQP